MLLPVGAALAIGVPEASAASVQQFCYYDAGGHPACLNAWGGGPYVNVETSDNTVIQNNHFQLREESNGYVELQFAGGGKWNGRCIGDASNDPNLADTSLDACGSITNGAGWGTQFQIAYGTGDNGCPDNTIFFYNNHWSSVTGKAAWDQLRTGHARQAAVNQLPMGPCRVQARLAHAEAAGFIPDPAARHGLIQPKTTCSPGPDCLGSGWRIMRNEISSPARPARMGMSSAI